MSVGSRVMYQSEVFISDCVVQKPELPTLNTASPRCSPVIPLNRQKSQPRLPVTGTGHAIKVSSASSDDYIYTGKGTSSFAGFTTDADTVYIRKQGNVN